MTGASFPPRSAMAAIGLVIHQAATAPGVVIKCNVLGAVRIKQKEAEGEVLRNDRYILCPHNQDASHEPIGQDGVPDHLRSEIEQFFLTSVLGTGKKIKVKGWQDAAEARRSIENGMKEYARRKK